MSQNGCKLSILGLIFLASELLVASELSIKCTLLDKESKISLNLKLLRGEAIRSADEGEQDEARTHSMKSTLTLESSPPVQMKGVQEKMRILDWERLDYDPLDLLDLREGNVDNATFYYAKENDDSRDFDLILVALEKINANGAPSYAGSYGSYKGSNLLCPLH